LAALLTLGAAGCSAPQNAPAGMPGSVTVHMGGSINSFGGFSSSR